MITEKDAYDILCAESYLISKGVRPCCMLEYPKGILTSGVLEGHYDNTLKIYVTEGVGGEDFVYIYKYDFIKDLIEMELELPKGKKGGKRRAIINGLLFGYGLSEIDNFIKGGN